MAVVSSSAHDLVGHPGVDGLGTRCAPAGPDGAEEVLTRVRAHEGDGWSDEGECPLVLGHDLNASQAQVLLQALRGAGRAVRVVLVALSIASGADAVNATTLATWAVRQWGSRTAAFLVSRYLCSWSSEQEDASGWLLVVS